MEDFIIAVFTRGRTERQATIQGVPEVIRGLITLFCHPGELEEHKKNWGDQLADIQEYGQECTHAGEARHWIMKYCRRKGIKYAIMMDDNMVFSARSDGKTVDFGHHLWRVSVHFNEEQQCMIYSEMFNYLLDVLRAGYGIAGIAHRSGNCFAESELDECSRIFGIWGISVDKYFELKGDMRKYSNKDDFYIQLLFLTNGIKTIRNNTFAFDKVGGANAKGGCSIYRKIEKINEVTLQLKQEFPDFIKVVEKTNNNWSNVDGCPTRKDVLVKWKKAYESSQKKQG